MLLLMKIVKLRGTFSVNRRHICQFVESEMEVWAMNLQLDFFLVGI